MLDFFRYYQRAFFLVITIVLVVSFGLWGTYDALFQGAAKKEDRTLTHAIDGSKIMLSEVHKIARFLSADRDDPLRGKNLQPNFCNDGVIRIDFLQTRLADLLVLNYFDALREDFASRLEKAKRYRPYVHPEADFLSAHAAWDHYIPAINQELALLADKKEVGPDVFAIFSNLYQHQSFFQPELLRNLLIHQHKQCSWLHVDQRLRFDDLSLFGFHSIQDWFGRSFIDLVAQFILNAAFAAEEKGYQVSLEEAKGDLLYNFQTSMQKMAALKVMPEISMAEHLASLGFDEKSAAEAWRKVILFRRYFQDVGQSAFIDQLSLKDFSEYAGQIAVIQKYELPFHLKTAQDIAEFQLYMKAVCPASKEMPPTSCFSVEQVEKKYPDLVETAYRAQVAEVSKKQLGLRATLKEVLDWELADKNWLLLRERFSILPVAVSQAERFAILERMDPVARAEIDAAARLSLVEQNPSWVEEALAKAAVVERVIRVKGGQEPKKAAEKPGFFVRIDQMEVAEEKHILTFDQARTALAGLVTATKEEKNPFINFAEKAIVALQKNPADPKWINQGANPLIDQFKFLSKQQEILRTSQENWMKEQAFVMLPEQWSPIHVADDGQIVFFYMQEKKQNASPILDLLTVGKETLAADAKRYLAQQLLEKIRNTNAIVIPVQKGSES